MIEGPISSYSFFEIHSWLNVPNEANIEPPNQLLLLRSTWFPAACTLTLLYMNQIELMRYCERIDMKSHILTPGTITGKSLLNLSVNPGKSVLPPVTITLLKSKGRKSISQALILLNTS